VLEDRMALECFLICPPQVSRAPRFGARPIVESSNGTALGAAKSRERRGLLLNTDVPVKRNFKDAEYCHGIFQDRRPVYLGDRFSGGS